MISGRSQLQYWGLGAGITHCDIDIGPLGNSRPTWDVKRVSNHTRVNGKERWMVARGPTEPHEQRSSFRSIGSTSLSNRFDKHYMRNANWKVGRSSHLTCRRRDLGALTCIVQCCNYIHPLCLPHYRSAGTVLRGPLRLHMGSAPSSCMTVVIRKAVKHEYGGKRMTG